MPLFLHLQQLGLLTRPLPTSRSTPKPPFVAIRKPLRLIVDDVDEQNPHDMSYVYSGYAPMSVRLVQCALGGGGSKISGGGGGSGVSWALSLNGWRGVEEVVKALPGETVDEWQKVDETSQRQGEPLFSSFSPFLRCFFETRRLTLVLVLQPVRESFLRPLCASSVVSLTLRSQHCDTSTVRLPVRALFVFLLVS